MKSTLGFLWAITLLCLANLSYADDKDKVAEEDKKFEGTWKVTSMEIGEPVPSVVESSTPGLSLSRSGVHFEESILESSKQFEPGDFVEMSFSFEERSGGPS